MSKFAYVVALGVGLLAVVGVRADEEKVPLDKLPKAVKEAVEKRFPKVEMTAASKEKDGDKVVYEVSLKKGGKNIDVTLAEAGVITLIEQEVAFADLPKPVADTFTQKYPGAKYGVIESVTKVEGGKETLDYYEAHFTTKDGKAMEAEVFPDGKFKAEAEAEDKEAKEKKDEKK